MQYIIVGTGGQGVLSASKVLGETAIAQGKHALGSEVHGMAQRGGSVVSHLKIGSYASPLVKLGDADVLLAFDQNEAARNLPFLRDGGALIINISDKAMWENEPLKRYLKRRNIRIFSLNGYQILSEDLDGDFLCLNSLILGALCAAGIGAPKLEEIRPLVSQLSPDTAKGHNLKALELGFRSVTV